MVGYVRIQAFHRINIVSVSGSNSPFILFPKTYHTHRHYRHIHTFMDTNCVLGQSDQSKSQKQLMKEHDIFNHGPSRLFKEPHVASDGGMS